MNVGAYLLGGYPEHQDNNLIETRLNKPIYSYVKYDINRRLDSGLPPALELIDKIREQLKSVYNGPLDSLNQVPDKVFIQLLDLSENFLNSKYEAYINGLDTFFQLSTLLKLEEEAKRIFNSIGKDNKIVATAIKQHLLGKGLKYTLVYGLLKIFKRYTENYYYVQDLSEFFRGKRDYIQGSLFASGPLSPGDLDTLLNLRYDINNLEDKFGFSPEIFELMKSDLLAFTEEYIYNNKVVKAGNTVEKEFQIVESLFNFLTDLKRLTINDPLRRKTTYIKFHEITSKLGYRTSRFIANKLRRKGGFTYTNCERIKKLIGAHIIRAPNSGSKLYQLTNNYLKTTIRHISRIRNNDYHKDWKKWHPENCYIILLETMGFNLWSRMTLDDTRNWNLHHIDENKMSFDSNKLILVYQEENLVDIPHLYNLNQFFKGKICTLRDIYGARRLLRTRKIIMRDAIIQLLKLGRTITKNDLGLVKQILDKDQWGEFIDRINFFLKEGESQWFEKYLNKFYNDNKDNHFWNTHYLTLLRNQKQGIHI